jgi:hypothetical protein
MVEAASTSETLVNVCQTTQCYNPEDTNLYRYGKSLEKDELLHIGLIYHWKDQSTILEVTWTLHHFMEKSDSLQNQCTLPIFFSVIAQLHLITLSV